MILTVFEIGHFISILCQFPLQMYLVIITSNMIINYKHKLSHRCETNSVIYKCICENYLGVHMFLF